MADSLLNEVAGFQSRLSAKAFLRPLTRGWERRIGLAAEDTGVKVMLIFSNHAVQHVGWTDREKTDLMLYGSERNLAMMFAGDEFGYLRASSFVRKKGPLRDQLKLDALLRLTASSRR
ncbi:MAG: SCP-2 sterol transfer family protein [Brevibacillus sp.]|nr:SCP-2 sterol transfer family protein [Brevibacillus sp.]